MQSSNVKIDDELVQNERNYTQSFLTLCGLTVVDSGTYTCQAENRVGFTSSDSVITVYSRARILMAPNDTAINAGETLQVACSARGEFPTVTWLMEDVVISNNTDDRTTIYDRHVLVNGTIVLQSTLVVENVSDADSGLYACLANSRASRDESNFIVSVNSLPATIEMLPPSEIVAMYRGNITIQVSARGYPLPTITWYRNNQTLTESVFTGISVVEELQQGNDRVVIFSLRVSGDELSNSVAIEGVVNNGLAGGSSNRFVVQVNVQSKFLC